MIKCQFKGIFNFFNKKVNDKIKLTLISKYLNKEYIIYAEENENLMDCINSQGISDLSVFGVCDKQLSCQSCSVKIYKNKKFDKIDIKKPSEEELDVLNDLKDVNEYTRMSCQIYLNKSMNDCVIEVNDASFFGNSNSSENNNNI